MISHKIAVHQLIDVCTTRGVHVHISCWTSAQQLLCDRRTYIFRRHHLNIPTTSIISFEDFYWLLEIPFLYASTMRKYNRNYEEICP